MSRSVLADTGPLYAAVDPDDQYHARAQEQLDLLDAQGLSVVLAYPILLETCTLIRYLLGAGSAAAWLEDVREGSTWVNPSPQDYRGHRVGRALSRPVHHPVRCHLGACRGTAEAPGMDL